MRMRMGRGRGESKVLVKVLSREGRGWCGRVSELVATGLDDLICCGRVWSSK